MHCAVHQGVHCAVHQGVHQCVRAPVCTTAAINRLQSSLALSACKSGAVVVVGVGWGLVLVHPHSHLHQDQDLGLISCEFVTSIQLHNCVVLAIW